MSVVSQSPTGFSQSHRGTAHARVLWDFEIFAATNEIKFIWGDFHVVGIIPGFPTNILVFTFKSVCVIHAMLAFWASHLWGCLEGRRNHLGLYQLVHVRDLGPWVAGWAMCGSSEPVRNLKVSGHTEL